MYKKIDIPKVKDDLVKAVRTEIERLDYTTIHSLLSIDNPELLFELDISVPKCDHREEYYKTNFLVYRLLDIEAQRNGISLPFVTESAVVSLEEEEMAFQSNFYKICFERIKENNPVIYSELEKMSNDFMENPLCRSVALTYRLLELQLEENERDDFF